MKTLLGRSASAHAPLFLCLITGLALGLSVQFASAQVTPIADSRTDWSGVQGQGGWSNGYYSLTADSDSTYQLSDFQPFLNDDWNGTGYDFEIKPPWTILNSEFTHPNGANNGNEQWTIRRWTANVTTTTPLALEWNSRAQTSGGSGTTGILMINGVEVVRGTTNQTGPGLKEIASDPEPAGVGGIYYANVNPGDIIELALSPEGAGDRRDWSDGSFNRLRIIDDLPEGPLFNPPTPGVMIADSAADWSTTGTQGENSWFYGYYDQREDVTSGDGVYGPEDLIPFLNDGSDIVSTDAAFGGWKDSLNHWNGNKFDLLNQSAPGANHGPWTELTGLGGHPAANSGGDGEVQWFIRRWVNMTSFSGDVEISGLLNNVSAAADGTVGRIFLNGVEIWNAPSDGTNVDVDLTVAIEPGDFFDFAVDPDGAGMFDGTLASVDLINDESDTTVFTVVISTASAPTPFVPIPEPATGLLAAIAAGLFVRIRRRRNR